MTLAVAAPASGATVTIGPTLNPAVSFADAQCPPAAFPITLSSLQTADAGSKLSFTAPSAGTIVTARAHIGETYNCPGLGGGPAAVGGAYFQVWRPTRSTAQYTLVGLAGPFTAQRMMINEYAVNVPVQAGDAIGWGFQNVNAIAQASVAGMTNEFPFINVGGFSVGGTLAFEQASEEPARLLINADMVEGDSSGGGGSGDSTPPTVKFTKPQYWKSGSSLRLRKYKSLRKFKFTAESDTKKAEIAVIKATTKRSKSGKRRKVCKVLKKNTRSKRKAFTKAKRSYCKVKKVKSKWWLKAKVSGEKGSLKLKRSLTKGSYTAYLRGTDEAGNKTSKYKRGDNRVKFKIRGRKK